MHYSWNRRRLAPSRVSARAPHSLRRAQLFRAVLLSIALALPTISSTGCVRADCAKGDLVCDGRYLLWQISDCPATTSWHTFLGGAANSTTVVNAIPDGVGGYYVAGIAADDFISNPIRAFDGVPGNLNNFLLRLNNDGSILWGSYLGRTGGGGGTSLAVGEEGVTFLGNVSAGFGAPINAYQGGNDLLIARITPNGQIAWNTFQGTAGNDQGAGIARRSDGGFWLVGQMQNPALGAAGTILLPHPNPGADAGFVQRLDANGNAVSHSFFGSAATTIFRGLAVSSTDELFAFGDANGALSGAYPNTIVNFSGGAAPDGLLVKLNAEGAYLFHTFQGEATNSQVFNGGAVLSDGSIIVGNSSPVSYGAPLAPFSGGTSDMVVSRYTSAGALLWQTFAGGAGADNLDVIGSSRTGGVWVGGSSDATFGTPISPFVHNGGGANHSALLGVSPDGALGAPLFFGTAAATAGLLGILETCEGGLLLANRSNATYGSRPLTPYGGGPLNGLLIRLDTLLQLSTF